MRAALSLSEKVELLLLLFRRFRTYPGEGHSTLTSL
jgi:hypothetical protein